MLSPLLSQHHREDTSRPRDERERSFGPALIGSSPRRSAPMGGCWSCAISSKPSSASSNLAKLMVQPPGCQTSQILLPSHHGFAGASHDHAALRGISETRSCTQPIASPAVRSAATSASSRALSRRTCVFSHAAMVKSRRADSRRLAASSDFSD